MRTASGTRLRALAESIDDRIQLLGWQAQLLRFVLGGVEDDGTRAEAVERQPRGRGGWPHRQR